MHHFHCDQRLVASFWLWQNFVCFVFERFFIFIKQGLLFIFSIIWWKWIVEKLKIDLFIIIVFIFFIYKLRSLPRKIPETIKIVDRLFGIVVSTSDCHPRGHGFDSRLYPRNFSGSIGSGTGSTQPREDNWVATWYEK